MNTQDYSPVRYIERDSSLPTIRGTANSEIGQAGAKAEIYVGGEKFLIDIDPATGTYSWTPTVALPDGEYSLSLRIIDAAKNISTPMLYTLVIDTTAPEAPELLKLFDDVGQTSLFAPGDTTDDKRPTLTGIAQKGTIVYLRDAGGNDIGSAVADKVTGKWVMDPVQDLAAGINNLTLVAVETFAGKTREGVASEPFTIIISDSTLPPNTIIISDAFDNAGSATGVLKSGALTDDTTPTLNGDVSAGSTVTVYWRAAGSSSWLGSSTATVTGQKWTWTPGAALPVGEYEFQAQISGGASTLFTLDIATAEQIALKTNIQYADDNFGANRGELANGAITDDTTPELHGRGEANGKVVVRYTLEGGAAATITVDVDSAGNWNWTPGAALAQGNWTFEVQAQGQTAWQSEFNLEITDAAGFGPTITGADDNVGAVQDPLNSGDTTDDTTPTLRGRAEANAELTLRYTLDGAAAMTATLIADAHGNWTWTAPQLAAGDWTFEVRQAGSSWKSFELTIEPASEVSAPTIDYAFDNVGTTGELSSGSTTDDFMPELHGSAKANSLVYLQTTKGTDSTVYSVMTDSAGKWNWTPEADLARGKWSFEVSDNESFSGGDKFDLTLKTAGTVSGDIDWQNHLPEFNIGHAYSQYDNYIRVSREIDRTVPVLINTPAALVSELGDKTVSLTNNAGIHFHSQASGDYYYSDFSVDLYNPNAFTISAGVGSINGNGASDFKLQGITLLPFEMKTVTSDEISNLLPNYYAIIVRAVGNQVYVDNLKYSLIQGKSVTAIQTIEDDSQHYLDVVDELNESPIIGKEQQIDTLTLTGKDQLLDLTKHADAIKSVEIFDITGNGDNTLKLDLSSLLSHGEKNLFVDDGKTQLLINGDKGDVVQLDDILPEGFAEGSWEQQTGNIVIAGVEYQVYSHSSADAELLVQGGVKTEIM